MVGYTIQNNNKTNFSNNFNAISVVGYTIQNNNKTNVIGQVHSQFLVGYTIQNNKTNCLFLRLSISMF